LAFFLSNHTKKSKRAGKKERSVSPKRKISLFFNNKTTMGSDDKKPEKRSTYTAGVGGTNES
jgi:hypothetical protein